MVRLRNMAAAYLENEGAFLLMKRSDTRKFAPGIWTAVGGHMEPSEISDPRSACLREVCEETGLAGHQITGLTLKYIILRRSEEEIRIQYVFFGRTESRRVLDTDEGELHWIQRSELLERQLSFTSRAALGHFMQAKDQDQGILVGTVSTTDNGPEMHWSCLQDWAGI